MQALINGWRAVWKQGDFPFYYVQLAPFRYGGDPLLLAQIWEAQRNSLSIPNTGMAVITDVTNLADIHPKNKQDVGKRLALWALAGTYGQGDLVYSGPLYESMSVEENKIRIRFDHVGSGLASRDGQALNWFTIAAADQNFVEAKAEIDGHTLLVWSDNVEKPAAVRFGWHQEAEPNLMNKEGLPASPFRTDDWPLEQGNK
jgi:sialate O-acetylesterase